MKIGADGTRDRGLAGSEFVKIVRADVHRANHFTVEIEDHTQIGFEVRRVDRATQGGREVMDFVSAQPWIEWIIFQNLLGYAGGFPLARTQIVEMLPESF